MSTATLTRPTTGAAFGLGLTVAYCRISKDREGRQLGVDRQTEDTSRLGEILGASHVELVVENDKSASSYAKEPRPLWEDIVRRVESGEISHVLAYSLSRLTRDLDEANALLRLRKLGLSVTTVIGQRIYPGMSAEEVRMIRYAAVNDAAESDLISERTSRSFEQTAERGTPHGPIAYGWDRARVYGVGVVDTINEAEADVLREAARRMIAGEATLAIVRDLNAREIPAPRGGKWSTTILTKLMLRPRNIARRVHQGEIVETNLPDGRAAWEPLYDDDTHAAVVAHLRDPARLRRRGATRHLLGGLLTCGGCGSSRVYVKHGSSGAALAYGCVDCHLPGLRRNQEALDLYVAEVVCARMARPDALDDRTQDRAALDAARARVATLRGKLAERVDMFDNDELTREEFTRSSTRLRAQIAEAEAAVEVARPLPGAVRGLMGHGDVEATRAVWESFSLDQRKAAIKALLTITLLPAKRGAFRPETVQLDWLTA